MESIVTHFVAFLVGAFAGAAGNYLAAKYTDQRRASEQRQLEQSQLRKICRLMPELVEDMKADFHLDGFESVREMLVLPNKRVAHNVKGKHFVYYEDEHQDLKQKVSVLENQDLVQNISVGTVPKYRISEEFYESIKHSLI